MKNEKSCGCIIIQNNKVLLISTKDKNNKMFWSFPKGHQEIGESDIETALRETKEEVGIDAKIIDTSPIKTSYLIHDGTTQKNVLLFISEPLNSTIKLQKNEVEKAKWVPIEKVESYLDEYYNNAWIDCTSRLGNSTN